MGRFRRLRFSVTAEGVALQGALRVPRDFHLSTGAFLWFDSLRKECVENDAGELTID